MEFFTKNLKYLRDRLGKSQPDVASDLGHPSRSRIANYEAGSSKPGLDDLIILAKYYKVTIDELLNKDISSPNYSTVSEPAGKYGAGDINMSYLLLENETLKKRVSTLDALNKILSTDNEDLKNSNASLLMMLKNQSNKEKIAKRGN